MQSSRRTAKKKPLTAKFHGDENGKLAITCREEADRIMDEIRGERFEVLEVKKGERVKKAPLPFTTSTLQQEASKTLNFPISKTMRIAQQLHEGVDVKGQGTVGLITYLRTDSVRISDEADADARAYIAQNYGEEFVATQTVTQKGGAKIQDAHEGDPSFRHCENTGGGQGISFQRPVPPLSADLEAFCRKQNGFCGI